METLKKLRKSKGLTQAELGKILGVSPSTIGMYEQGRRTPDKDALIAISNYFNVSTDYLLENEKAPDAHPDLPPLTPRDERNIAKEIEKILDGLDNSAALGGSIITDDEDLELLKSSLTQAVTLAKRVAKQKFTPKKYRKEWPFQEEGELAWIAAYITILIGIMIWMIITHQH